MTLTRKDFLKTGLAAAGAVAGIGGTACGGDDKAGSGGGGGGGCSTTMTPSHGHTLSIAAADVSAGVAKTYNMTGGGHSHDVLVSPANFSTLQTSKSASVTSAPGGSDNHSHSITITC